MAGSKLTKAQHEFRLSLARTIISVAERHPLLRGPWIFDEERLQAQAKRARNFLALETALREAQNG